MGKLMYQDWGRLVALTSGTYVVWGAFWAFFYRKFFWDMIGGVLGPVGLIPPSSSDIFVKLTVDFPLFQIFNLLNGLFTLALEYSVPFLENSALNRSHVFKSIFYFWCSFWAILVYQTVDASLFYLFAIDVERLGTFSPLIMFFVDDPTGAAGTRNLLYSAELSGGERPGVSSTVGISQRERPSDLGLTSDKISKSGIYVGALPDWTNESPRDINQRLGAPIAIVGDYVSISPSDTSLGQMDWHSYGLSELPEGTVYAPAIIPSRSLEGDGWTGAMRDALVEKCRNFNRRNITVWLRFAYEMNGEWMAYGLQPEPFITAFRDLASAVHASTNSTFMLWSPNIYGSADATDVGQLRGYEAYYPGTEYVDIAGLSFYSSGEGQTLNTVTPDGTFFSLFSRFHDRYGPSHPVVVSETAAQYHYYIPQSLAHYPADSEVPFDEVSNLTSLTPHDGGASEVQMKAVWAQQLLAVETKNRFPNLTAVSFFNYIKIGNASAEQLNDYRIVGGNATVEDWHRTFFGNQTAYQLGYDDLLIRSSLPAMIRFLFALLFSGLALAVDQLQIGVKHLPADCPFKSQIGDTLAMHYTGMLAADGTKFDSSLDRGQPFKFRLGVGQVIKGPFPFPPPLSRSQKSYLEGWDQGLTDMCVGEKRKLVIPSSMGYGSRGAPGAIPPNADLIFEVELLEIVGKTAPKKEEL
ncbi:glycoside hydrolase family 26 protein [Atractiella rhizophila]|nr:glycoside hydrolase family 26 protein [Atractiella rhizophila]